MHTLIAPLRIRSTGEAGRKVTWLELFFDLIFVAAVAQVAEPLRDHYSVIGEGPLKTSRACSKPVSTRKIGASRSLFLKGRLLRA